MASVNLPQAAVSAAAMLLALALLALAARRLFIVAERGLDDRPLPPRRVPPLIAGWIGLLAFAAGMYVGRTFWQ